MHFIRNYIPLILVISLFITCTNDQKKPEIPSKKLTVAVAANVQFAMKALKTAFEATSDTELDIIIGSSGKLTAQIIQGAPYDLLISANMKYPETLFQKGFATQAPKIYAYGSLVLWTMHDFDLVSGLSILKNNPIKKIAIANPKNAPYGEQAIQAFQHSQILHQIKTKLVYGESIAQTNQYILSKVCDVGITAKSVVLSPDLKGKGQWIDVPATTYEKIAQGVVITSYGHKQHPATAHEFYDFLFSETAQAILKMYGYITKI